MNTPTLLGTQNIITISSNALSYFRKNAAGGWWNLTTGQTAPQSTSSSHSSSSSSSSNIPPEQAVPFGAGTEFESKPGSAGELLESRIAELAEQLGISEPAQLASAIKPLVHPTKASAILDAEPEETEVSSGSDEGKTPTLVDILVEDERKKRAIKAQADTPLGWMEAVVGMDEPPTEMPN